MRLLKLKLLSLRIEDDVWIGLGSHYHSVLLRSRTKKFRAVRVVSWYIGEGYGRLLVISNMVKHE